MTCLHKVVDDFCEMIDDGDMCGICFQDVEKCFDTIHHGILLQKLEYYGIQGYALCYVAICDRRILWRCRNLWLKVSQFVTGVAICDGKCRNLWQRQNMQFNDIYSLNFDKYFVLSSYL